MKTVIDLREIWEAKLAIQNAYSDAIVRTWNTEKRDLLKANFDAAFEDTMQAHNELQNEAAIAGVTLR